MTRKDAERQEAIERLKEWIKPGDTIYCNLKSRSRSGMSRTIQLIKFENGEPQYLGYNAAAAIGNSYDEKREGVRIGGCGMDMGFALVYELASVLFPDGFECIGDKKESRCPSNDHFNGDRNYAPHHHTSGGYALRHRWL